MVIRNRMHIAPVIQMLSTTSHQSLPSHHSHLFLSSSFFREKLRLEGKATGPRAEAAAKATKEAEAKRAEKRTRVERALDGVPKPLLGIFRNSLQKLV